MQTQDPDLMRRYFSGYFEDRRSLSTGLFTSERYLLDGVRSAYSQGCVIGTHAPASHHNLSVLRDAGISRVTVLLRDPRDSTVSWTYHLRSIGPDLRNFHTLAYHFPLDYYDWEFKQQLSYQVKVFLPAAVSWIESWRDASEHMPELSIQLVGFKELAETPQDMFRRVLSFHGIKNFDIGRIPKPEPGQRHFRAGRSGDWKSEFSTADAVLAESLLGGRLAGVPQIFDAGESMAGRRQPVEFREDERCVGELR